jgi:predicted RNA-binding protein YlxR (DUF448 family)
MKHQPERTCIGCRAVRKKDEVIRVIAGPSGVVIDYREKLDGRAAYICPDRECIKKALSRDSLAKALRIRVSAPDADAFVAQLTANIEAKIKSLLAVAIKAGALAAGYSAVQDALEKGRVELLLFARDLANNTREKMSGEVMRSLRQETLFTRDDFGALLNRELIGVVAILDKGLADALWSEVRRLKGLINISE